MLLTLLYFSRSSTSDSETAGQSEESCTTTFSTSPSDGNLFRAPLNVAPHHQSQPIKINIQGSSPDADNFYDKASRYVQEHAEKYFSPSTTL